MLAEGKGYNEIIERHRKIRNREAILICADPSLETALSENPSTKESVEMEKQPTISDSFGINIVQSP